MKVAILIVNYKVPGLTNACLASLRAEVEEFNDAKVVVVDNDSGDGSLEEIQSYVSENGWNSWVDVVASDKNGGFAYGNNYAIQHLKNSGQEAEFYWFLNPDTQAYKGSMTKLVKFMEAQPKVGITGSSILNDDGSLWPICFKFPGILSEFERGVRLGLVTKLLSRWKVPQEMAQVQAQVDWLPGASFMIRDKVFNDIGLMDDKYFLYYEETDFCLNAARAGWQCWYVPESQIMHIAGASTGVVDQKVAKKPLPQYMFDSRRRYFSKNHGAFYAGLADLSWLLAHGLWIIRRTITLKQNEDPANLFFDSLKNAVFVRFFSGKK